MKSKHTVLVGMPTYLGKVEAKCILPLIHSTKRGDIAFDFTISDSSANCMAMNVMWLQAQQYAREGKITHFLMHHSDIVPEYWWMDKLMGIMERTGADILSAVVPIKDSQGFTSTAIDESPIPAIPTEWRVRRLTMREVFKLEPTFTHPKLLLNDGLMLVDMTKPWTQEKDVYFTFRDTILEINGKRSPFVEPEDWGFSRKAARHGAKLFATREVALHHIGPTEFPNSAPWGTAHTDSIAHCPGVPDEVFANLDSIEGWFTLEEAASIYLAAKKALDIAPNIVEVGSFQGRSTYVLAKACEQRITSLDEKRNAPPMVWAVDPHAGDLYANGQGIKMPPSYEAFEKNMTRLGVREFVHPLVKKSEEVKWDGGKIGLLFIDGLHDYENVSKDFEQFYRWMAPGGYVCFHDYADSDPDVKRFVDEEVGTGALEVESQTGSLRICRVPVGASKKDLAKAAV